ncbi:DNA primase small subunit [Arthroderma uncinatum]|uniref:DNA primase small subunit n=1 Tax=Arthroderma uncinatum TaxID=74035 RepID=UPI00144AEABC|nr:DNA primase small subunit [Arthroderma uncinatum]KAF3479963.1 DNA primase small subunit [Arthroderma uncinatum]
MEDKDAEVLPDAPQPDDTQKTAEDEATGLEGDADKDAKKEANLEDILFKDDDDDDVKKPKEESAEEKKDVKLEDMFNDDDDEDEEFPDSDAVEIPKQPAPPTAQVDPESMSAFYQRLFPFKYLFQWLNHGIQPSTDFGNREFAFTLPNDAYLRYQSYQMADMLHKDVMRLNPSRFEIGPVYTTNPRDRKSLPKPGAFKPISKELVFDIDLTDYDDIRTCCSKANICLKCWSFVTMSIKVIDAALREDFGFEHILWVYSGRRGAHAWVCDKKARNLPDDRRRAIAGYLEVVRGGSQSGKRVNLKRPLHPHIARSLETLKPYFASTILMDQDSFSKPDQASRLLELLPDKTLKAGLQKKWESAPERSSSSKWADIDAVARTSSRGLDTKALLEAKQDIVLEYTYPRLDAEVSKKLIHLLKSPFVVHPGTGRVCVPIDIRKVDEFNPLEAPTLSDLLDEINSWSPSQASQQDQMPASDSGSGQDETDTAAKPRKVQDYEKTSLKPYIDYFRSFVAGLNKDERPVKRERAEDGSNAMEF